MEHKRLPIIIFLCLLLLLTFPLAASADFGPKPKLTVHVVNPPGEPYYLDLLIQNSTAYDNLYEGRENLNPNMLKLLYSYENEGWKPALTEGTKTPLFGKLTGEPSGDEMLHEFGYYGLPDTYRIIIVTESGEIRVSDVSTRNVLQGNITFDYLTGQTKTPSLFKSYLIQFISTCVPTLLIECVILLLFGFKLKENLKVFITTNILTQTGLTLAVGSALIFMGTLGAGFFMFPAEIAVIIVEAVICKKFLKGKTPGRRAAYVVVANLSSWLISFLIMNAEYELLSSLI